MNIDTMKNAIGLIGSDLIEAADETPVKAARVTSFTNKSWMKWVAAAVAVVVFAVGTPIALNMMGAFRSDNLVAPGSNGGSEAGNSGVVTPVGGDSESSEPESGSGQSSEEASSSSEGEKPAHGDSSGHADSGSENPPVIESESAPGSSEQEPESGSSETLDEPGTGGGIGRPDSDGPAGTEFIKDNVPPITCRIAGKSKTFSYTVSEWVTTHLEAIDARYSIDRYVGSDGSSVLINSESGELIQFENGNYGYPDSEITEETAIRIAKQAVLNTDIAMSGLESAEVSVREWYYVTLTVPEGRVTVYINTAGALRGIYVNKSGS